MPSYTALLNKVKEQIKPDLHIIKEVDAFVNNINTQLKKAKINATCVKGGSVGKGTFLKNDHDVDLFVRFNIAYKEKNISDLLQQIVPKSAVRIHGSRDYFQIHQNLHYELVPVLDVKNEQSAENVTDMSPLHVTWVLSKIKNKKFLLDEIRLAKQFCKACKVYGAESHIKGFSGHILDILIINYGGFINLLKASQKWKEPIVIDIEKKLKNPLFELNQSKLSPLIIVDPLQKRRNAAAALSKEKLLKFISAAKAFLEKPSEAYFTIRHLTQEDIQAFHKKYFSKEKLILLKIIPHDGKADIVGSKIVKLLDFIKLAAKEHEFKLLNFDWELQQTTYVYFIFKNQTLSPLEIVRGPPINALTKQNVLAFKKKHKTTFMKDKVVYAKEKRQYTSITQLIPVLLKDAFCKDKAKKIELIL